MQADIQLLESLTSLVLKNANREALAEIERRGFLKPGGLHAVRNQASLALLIADICFNNQRYAESEECLCLLKNYSSDIENDIRYIELKSGLLMKRGKIHEALSILEGAIDKDWAESQHYSLVYHLGCAHLWSGDYIKTNRHLQTCYQYYSSVSDHFMMGRALYGLGYAAFQRCFYEMAEFYYRKALDDYETSGSELEIGRTHQMLGILAYRKGMYNEARRNLAVAKQYYTRCSYQIGLINLTIAFARIAMFKRKYKSAERILQGTFRRAQMINYERGAALSAEFLGEICYHLAQYTDALGYLEIAANHAAETAPHGDIAVEVLRRQGEVLIAVGREKEAEETLIKALEIAEYLHDHHELGAVLRAFGSLEERKGDLASARSYFKESIATFRLIKDPFELARTYSVAADFNGRWSQANNIAPNLRTELLDEARAYAIEGMHLYTSIGIEGSARQCHELSQEIESRTNGDGETARRERVSFDRRLLCDGLLVAKSRHMRDVVEKTRQIASTPSPVLICGETGTGKELIARLIHKYGKRAEGPFVAINCACVPETVFESEVFGHRRGSFTGAISDKIGLMEQASGGTLFLDEVSMLSSGQQAKLLRALQEGKIRRIGDLNERPVDVRIVSASNENAQELLSSGRLRSDFFYRIAGQTIELEPLRKRRDDIVPLFSYFACNLQPDLEVESAVLELLSSYHWPGNVRELMNVVNALVSVAALKGIVRVRDLPLRIRDYALSETDVVSVDSPSGAHKRSGAGTSPWPEDLALTREHILSSLSKCRNNRSAAARELGIGRSTFYRRMKELDLLKD